METAYALLLIVVVLGGAALQVLALIYLIAWIIIWIRMGLDPYLRRYWEWKEERRRRRYRLELASHGMSESEE